MAVQFKSVKHPGKIFENNGITHKSNGRSSRALFFSYFSDMCMCSHERKPSLKSAIRKNNSTLSAIEKKYCQKVGLRKRI
jgi:hypothetical protein